MNGNAVTNIVATSNNPSAPGSNVVSETSVRVAVRVRPLIQKEILEKSRECVVVDNDQTQIIVGKTRAFAFDFTYDKDATQKSIFDSAVQPLVENLFQGYNATVLAYGQTGSGKTYTMGLGTTNLLHQEQNEEHFHEMGIIPRVIHALFDKLSAVNSNDFLVRVSYLEIYNENVKDLLNPGSNSKPISIREDDKKGIVVVGIKEEVVSTLDDMIRCLEFGALYRTTGKTLMNEESSRSHSIFTIILEQKVNQSYILSKFHLVDLAGSERNKRTGASGIRFKESVQINSGLLALGNVISALGDDKKRANNAHVPYRESKLTRLLQDSLGGNSNTVMIACISPADSNFEETLNTLKYANRARNIKNKPIVNRDPHSAQLAHLRNQIQTLQLELLKHKKQEPGGDEESTSGTIVYDNSEPLELNIMREQNEMLKSNMNRFKAELQNAQQTVTELSEELMIHQHDKEKLAQRMKELCSELNQISIVLREYDSAKVLTEKQKKSFKDIIQKLEYFAKRERFELDKIAKRSNQKSSLQQQEFLTEANLELDDDTILSNNTVAAPVENTEPVDMNIVFKQNQIIAKLRDELMEARKDLSRDEQIVQEKVREIMKLNKINEQLKQNLENEMKKVHQFSKKRDTVNSVPSNNPEPPLPVFSAEPIIEEQTRDQSQTQQQPMQPLVQHDEESLKSEIERVASDIQKLEQEKEKVEKEKNVIESEKSKIESMALEQQQQFLSNQKKMEQMLRDLTVAIRIKEELIKDLVKNEQESKLMKLQYEQKIHDMENEVKTTHYELEKLMRDLETADMEQVKKEKEKQRIRSEYETRLKKKEQELNELKDRQLESKRLIKEKSNMDKKIKELEAEIQKLRVQQDSLRKRIKEEQEKQVEKDDQKAKQINSLKRESENNLKRIRDLEMENQRQKTILKKKTEEVEQVQQQLRIKPPTSARGRLTAEIDKQKAWLDKEIEKYLKKKEAMEILEKELRKRENIIQEKEVMLTRKQDLERKRLRSSQVLHQSIVGLTKQIEAIESEIVEKEETLSVSPDVNGSREIQEQLQLLQKKKVKALHKKSKLEKKVFSQLEKEEQEIRDLEEREEVLDAEIEYKNEAIEQAQQEISQNEDIFSIDDGVTSLIEAKSLLRKYFEKVIELKENEKSKEDKVMELEMLLSERDKIIENLQNNIRLTELVYERRLTKEQKENEMKVGNLMRQLANKEHIVENSNFDSILKEKEAMIAALEKENSDYKQTIKEQRTKIRSLVLLQEKKSKASTSESSSSQLAVTEQNEQLKNELTNIKSYLTKVHNDARVRKSQVEVSKDFKELSEEEVLELSKKNKVERGLL